MNAEVPSIIEPLCANMSCAPSPTSVYAHVLLVDCVREMMRFTSNVLAVQSDSPPLPAYISATIEPVLSPIYKLIIYEAAEQMSGSIIHILNTSSPPHLL